MAASVFLMFTVRTLLLFANAFEVFALTTLLMAKSERPFSSGRLSLPVLEIWISTLAVWCFILAQWMTLKPSLNKQRYKRARRPVKPERASMHLSAS